MSGATMAERLDPQQLEVIGRGHLVAALVREHIEVAQPVRDSGTDLVAYLEDDLAGWFGVPVQLKAFTSAGWSIARKYERMGADRLVYVWAWNVLEPAAVELYAATYRQSVEEIGAGMGYTQTASWIEHGAYTTTRPSRRLRQFLEPYLMGVGDWRQLVEKAGRS